MLLLNVTSEAVNTLLISSDAELLNYSLKMSL